MGSLVLLDTAAGHVTQCRQYTTLVAQDARNCGIQVAHSSWLTADGPTGEPGGNSAYRLAGVLNAFEVPPDLAASIRDASGPILLVDDLADSRWTLTVTARALRRAGAASVLPFALALRG